MIGVLQHGDVADYQRIGVLDGRGADELEIILVFCGVSPIGFEWVRIQLNFRIIVQPV